MSFKPLSVVNYDMKRTVKINPAGYPCIKFSPSSSGEVQIELFHAVMGKGKRQNITTFSLGHEAIELIVDTLQTYLLTR